MSDTNQATGGDWWLKLAQPRHWALFLLIYLALHMGMRLLLSDTLQMDDAEQLIQSQDWRLNYANFQPPFYTWVLWALWHVIEPSMAALYVIRYLIIGLTFWLWYRVSRLLFDDPKWIVASATSWLLLGEFAWKLHQGSTHTTLLTLALVMSLHAIVLILRTPSLRRYLYLGLAVGLGMMAKYSYAGFLVPMLLAGLTVPQTRDRLLRWPMLIALGVAIAVMLPALLSLLLPEAPVGDRLQGQTMHHAGGLLAGDPSVLVEFVKGSLVFLAPMWLVYAAIFRAPLLRRSKQISSVDQASVRHVGLHPDPHGYKGLNAYSLLSRNLLDRFYLIVAISMVVVALFVGIDHLKSRWLHPFLALVPFWWLLHASACTPRRHTWPVLKWITVALVALVVVARLWQLLASPYVGHKPSRVTWPVTEALQRLPAGVFTSPQLRVADTFLAAHIRLYRHQPVNTRGWPGQALRPGAVWMWGGTEKSMPQWVDRLPDKTLRQPHWVKAERGKATYWIGYITAASHHLEQ